MREGYDRADMTPELAAEFREVEWLDDEAVKAWLSGSNITGSILWKVSKKGNLWCRDFGCTYTIKSDQHAPEFTAVVVDAHGTRKDVGPESNVFALLRKLWPEGDLMPIHPED